MGKKDAGPPSGYNAPPGSAPGTPGNNPNAGVYQNATEAEAAGNRPTQNTPFGSTSWDYQPGSGWTQNTSGSPGIMQSIFNLMGQGASSTGSPISDGADARKQAYDSIYGRETARLDPQWGQQQNSVETQLANQGFVPGTAAYDKAFQNFSNAKNDAYDQARRTAEEQSGNAAQQQQQMDVTSKSAPFSIMQMIQGLLQQPGFNAGPQYLQAAMGTGQYSLQNQQLSNQAWSDMIGGLMGLGGQLGSAAIIGPNLKR